MATAKTPIACQDISLQRGKGNSLKGGGSGGCYWHIYVGTNRAGSVYINFIEDLSLGKHGSIHLFINESMRGRHIGRCVYQKACELSPFDIVYAHMRKSNIPSKKAALKAGFVEYPCTGEKQLILKWHRPTLYAE